MTNLWVKCCNIVYNYIELEKCRFKSLFWTLFCFYSVIYFLHYSVFCFFRISFDITIRMFFFNIRPVMGQENHTCPVKSSSSIHSEYVERLRKNLRPFVTIGIDTASYVDQLPTTLKESIPIPANDLATSFIEHYSKYSNNTAKLWRILPI